MQILGFSPRVYAEVRRFFAEHPVVEIKVRRDADMGSTPVSVVGGNCQRCGWEYKAGKLFVDTLAKGMNELGEELPRGTLPSDFLQAVELRHAYDQASRSVYCGGLIEFVTAPAF